MVYTVLMLLGEVFVLVVWVLMALEDPQWRRFVRRWRVHRAQLLADWRALHSGLRVARAHWQATAVMLKALDEADRRRKDRESEGDGRD
jgi:hypothetical protein